MVSRTIKSMIERLGQLEARLIQVDEGEKKLRGSTDRADRRQRSSLILEGEEIEAELLHLRSAVALQQGKT
jgi:hypothetical protein